MPHAEIKTKQATLTLEQLHAELAGKIIDNKKEADKLREAMLHVEAVIKLMNPNHNLRRIAVRRRKPNQWFKRGTIFRAVLDVLRKASEPLTVSEIAAAMLVAKGIKDSPRSAVANLEGGVRAALHKRDGDSVVSEGDPNAWKLKP